MNINKFVKKRILISLLIFSLFVQTGCSRGKAEDISGSKSEDYSVPDLFVSVSGDDAGDGSIYSPFRTIQAALDAVKPGQTIYLREGTYYGANTFVSSGLSDKPITIREYNNEHAFVTLDEGESGAIFDIGSNSFIDIDGLDIGNAGGERVFGILIASGAHDINITNNEIHHIVTTKPDDREKGEANAVLLLGEGPDEESAIRNVNISGNFISDNINGWSENISVAGNCEHIFVNDNVIGNNTNIGIDFYGNAEYSPDPEFDRPRFCEARGNLVFNCICPYAECAGIYVDGARDITVSGNTVRECAYGIEVGSEEWRSHYKDYEETGDINDCQNVRLIQVDNNVIYSNYAGGIRIGGYTEDETTGYVVGINVSENALTDNGAGEGGWNGEINFEKCDGVTVTKNVIVHTSEEFPVFEYGLGPEYSRNVDIYENTINGELQ